MKKELHVDRWKNRRAMAWIALIAGLTYPLLILYTESDQLGAVAGPFYVFVMGVVGAYIGFATFDDKWQNPNSMDSYQAKVSIKTLQEEGFPPEPK